MFRRIAVALLVIAVGMGCASSSKLSKKSEEKLASGDAWRAWQLATKALDKEPGNPRARAAATAAGAAIAEEWQRRIHALAESDSLQAAEQALELAEFRLNAARYATIPLGSGWTEEERTLRRTAARIHYKRGQEAAASGRPKKACTEFTEASRFVNDYKDVAARVDRAMTEALTRVTVLPFRTRSLDPAFGSDVAQAWQDDLVDDLTPPSAQFTRMLGAESWKRSLSLADLEELTREEAVRLGRKSGAQRVVWGSIGNVKSSTKLHVFKDTVARRIVEKGEGGTERTRWVEVPIEVVARVRDVTVGVDYEVIETKHGVTLAHRQVDRSTSARVVWTSYQPVGDVDSYALVSESVRTENPDRVRDVESRWKAVCGPATTLAQVLDARRKTRSGQYARESLPRFVAGAAFVFLEDLPPAGDLAFAALSKGSGPLREDLLRLDPIDDVDLGVALPDAASR